MIFSSWGRLVDLYEQRILKLFSHFKIIHDPKFEVAANAVAKAMAAETAGVNAASWRTAAAKSTNARRIHQALQREIETQNLEPVLRQIANQNAQLITKLPVQIRQEISRRAAELVREGARPAEVEKLIRQLRPLMIKSRVKLLARTAISSAETDLTVTRAHFIGIQWGVWTTSQDQRVRKSHQYMNGVLIKFDDPPAPEALIGEKSSLSKYLPGKAPNCRCLWLPLADLAEVNWPARVYRSGSITRMTRPQFVKMAGIPMAA